MRVVDRALAADAVGALIAERAAAALAGNAASELGLPGALAVTPGLGGIDPAGDRGARHPELAGDLPQQRALRTARAGAEDEVVTGGHEETSLRVGADGSLRASRTERSFPSGSTGML